MEVSDVVLDEGAARVRLVFAPSEPLRTSEVPGLTAAAIVALPGLRGHRCDNGAGLSFADELVDTELAHLFEHAALELMVMAGSSLQLRGDTSWDFARDGRGTFHVRVEYGDEAIASAALAFAAGLVGALMAGRAAPDAESQARRLRVQRGRERG